MTRPQDSGQPAPGSKGDPKHPADDDRGSGKNQEGSDSSRTAEGNDPSLTDGGTIVREVPRKK